MKRLCISTNFFLSILLCFSAFLSFTLAAETEECGQINYDQLRNKQKETEINEFPWMSKLAYNNTKTLKTSFLCQAVLIDLQHLLTVGHCLGDIPDREPYAVLFGDWNSENNYSEADCDVFSGKCSTPVLIDIEEIVLFPIGDKKGTKNDIALLRLTQKVAYTDYIRPICLPSNDIKTKEFGSELLTLTGWLRKENGLKLKRSIFIFNQHDCRRKYKGIRGVNITDSQLCGNACEDNQSYLSGTALMDVKDLESESPHQVYLVGLLSFGALKCNSSFPDVFTRVDQYLDWIKQNIS